MAKVRLKVLLFGEAVRLPSLRVAAHEIESGCMGLVAHVLGWGARQSDQVTGTRPKVLLEVLGRGRAFLGPLLPPAPVCE